MDDVYTYPRSGGVLVNRYDIRDKGRLEAVEDAYVRAAWASFKDLSGDPEWDMLRHIHQEMVGTLYEWAGELRTVYVTGSDPETDAPVAAYCKPSEIEYGLEDLFARLVADNYLRGLDEVGFLMGFDKFWGRLTRLHPFRDVCRQRPRICQADSKCGVDPGVQRRR